MPSPIEQPLEVSPCRGALPGGPWLWTRQGTALAVPVANAVETALQDSRRSHCNSGHFASDPREQSLGGHRQESWEMVNHALAS